MQTPRLTILPTATLRRGAVAAFSVQILGLGAAFGLQVVLARVLGPSQLGVYALVLSWLNVISLACPFGFDVLLLQRASVYRSKEQWGLFTAILRRAMEVTAICGVAFGVLLYLFAAVTASDSSTKLAFAAGAFLLPLLALNSVRQSALRVCKAIVAARAPDILIRPITLILLLLPWFLPHLNAQAWQAMALHAAAALVTFIVGTFLLVTLTPPKVSEVVPKEITREWFSRSRTFDGRFVSEHRRQRDR